VAYARRGQPTARPRDPINTPWPGLDLAGLPHYGHILAGTIKDVVTRYATQTGHYVSRRFGWDCHGLPIEFEIDKEHGISSKQQVLDLGIDKYNALCRGIVTRYCSEWETIVTRMGRWIDFRNDYKTMEPWYMESVWWVFSQLWKKDLVYRGFKVMPYSTGCTTPLSNFEVADNYRDGVQDPSVVVSFPIVGDADGAELVAWTTTPWTLPSNVALCVHPELKYVRVRDEKTGRVFVLAEARLVQLFPALGKKGAKPGFEVLAEMTGRDLNGTRYEPLFDFFVEDYGSTAFRVLVDEYVGDDAGTGVVHQAPAFGEDDFRVCLREEVVAKGQALPLPLDESGVFTSRVGPFAGMYFKDADAPIMAALKESGRMVQKSSIVHRYPFCWRSDTPIMYRAVPSWFIGVESMRSRLTANNAKSRWVPGFVSEKRFHNWLDGARDWCVSRNRYWGTPLPIWVSDDGEETVCVGSRKELAELSGMSEEALTDLHREHVDKIEIPSREGRGTLKRVEEVFDCWFESGSMPYAQVHYPFAGEEESRKFVEERFPADFIAEGLDQTRGWFYTLMVLSTALFDKPAFKNVIVNGLVLAEDGQKMSKRKKNYPDPTTVVESHGADALRLYLINSPVVRAETLKFSDAGVLQTLRQTMLPWYNTFRFLATAAAHLDGDKDGGFEPDAAAAAASTNLMDRWVLAATHRLVEYVRGEMEGYRLYTVVPRLVAFIDDLTNWYVRLNRLRLAGREGAKEARASLSCLYEVLAIVTRIMSPFTPFFAEWLYQRMRAFHPDRHAEAPVDKWGPARSLHFIELPEADASLMNEEIERAVATMQGVIAGGRAIRDRRALNTRTPVASIRVLHKDPAVVAAGRLMEAYISAELNCESIEWSSDVASACSTGVEADPKVLGKALGKQFRDVAQAAAEMSEEQVASFLATGSAELAGVTVSEGLELRRAFTGDPVTLGHEFVADPQGEPSLLVVMDCVITDELRRRGLSREVTNRVQKLRKAAGLYSTDVVHVFLEPRGVSADESAVAALHAASAAKASASISAPPAASAAAPKAKTEDEIKADKASAADEAAKSKKAAKKAAKKGAKKGAKKAAKGAAGAAAVVPVADEWPSLPAEEAAEWVRLALAENAASVMATLRLQPMPLCSLPPDTAVIAREVADLPMGVRLDIVITHPVPLAEQADLEAAAAEAGAADPKSTAQALRCALTAMTAADVPAGELTVRADGVAVRLAVGERVFATPAQYASAAADTWAAAGFGALAAALKA